MVDVNVQWEFDVLGAPTTTTPTSYIVTNLDGLTSLAFYGSGFTFDGNGVPTGGTISSVVLQENVGSAALVTITNLHISLSNYGSLITEILAWRNGITWQASITDGTAATFTSTYIRVVNGDGTFTDIIGSGFTETTDSGLAGGTVTAINHVAADGVTILGGLGGLSVSFQTIASALFDEAANSQMMALVNTGDNIVVGAPTVTEGFNTYIAHFADGAGSDTMTGTSIGVSFIEFGEFQDQAVNVNLATGTATAGSDVNTISNIIGVGGTIYDDQITGNASDNTLNGHEGNDVLTPGDGVDTVNGEDGNDIIVIGNSAVGETYDGGADFDTLALTNTTVVGAGITTVFATSTVLSIERVEFASAIAAPSSAVFLLSQIGAGIATTAQFYGDNNPNTVSFVASAPGAHTLAGTSFQLSNWTAGQDFVGLFANLNAPGVYTLTGSSHADFIAGGASGDTLNGEMGDDILRGNGGGDALNGGGGVDGVVYTGSASRVRVNLGTGAGLDADAQGDTYTSIENASGSSFNDVLLGNTGDNFLYGQAGNDQLTGANGNDTLIGGAGVDTLNGGNGFDTADYSASASRVRVNLTTGTGLDADAQGDTLVLVEHLIGSAFNDILTGDGAANIFVGGLGADTLDGAGGSDTADYSRSSESVHLDLDSSGVGGTAEGDTYANMENAIGSAFGDTLGGNSSNNALTGGEGDDYFFTDLGADALNGGGGYDIVDYQNSAARVRVNLSTGVGLDADAQGDTYVSIELVSGTVFNDIITGDDFGNTLLGQAGNDRLTGLGANDALDGSTGADILEGGDGEDALTGGFGADVLDGGGGLDSANYVNSAGRVRVNLTTNTGLDFDAAGDTFVSVENLYGSAFNDILTGDGAANILSGNAGNDTLAGMAGDDLLIGGEGIDALDGGANNDTADYSASGSGVLVNLTLGTGIGGSAQGDTLANVENIVGSSGDDFLIGNGAVNSLSGGAGFDRLVSGLGADVLDGGGEEDVADYSASSSRVRVNLTTNIGLDADAAGDTYNGVEHLDGSAFNDLLTGDGAWNNLNGGAGADRLTGLAGNDTLRGAAGADILEGGEDDDLLEGGTGADTLTGGNGVDTATYQFSTGRVRVNLATGVGLDAEAQGDTLSGIENLIGSAFSDVLTGDGADNRFVIGDGIDTVDTGAGIDTVVVAEIDAGESLNGGTGAADTLELQTPSTIDPGDTAVIRFDTATVLDFERLVFNTAGATMAMFLTTQLGGSGLYFYADIIGSANADSLVFRMASAGTFDLGASSDLTFTNWTPAQSFDDGGDIVAVFGSDGSDTITGTENADYLNGEWDESVAFGNDIVNGLGGDDVLEGWGGEDQLHGGEGDDLLTGWGNEWSGAEIIDGGNGFDTLGVGLDFIDFTNATITSIEALDLSKNPDAFGQNAILFSAAQVNSGFASNLAVNGFAPTGEVITVNATGNEAIDVSDWTFTNWNPVIDFLSPLGFTQDAINLNGGDGANAITGTAFGDAINGDATAGPAGGVDIIHGGDGGDLLDGWGGADQVYGEGGDDIIQAYEGEFVAGEIADGGTGNDMFETHGSVNFIGTTFVGFESLFFFSEGGVETFTFSSSQIGPGIALNADVEFDSFGGASQSVVINMAAGGAFTLAGWSITGALATDSITINGTAGVDTITGTTIGDRLFGQGGADTLNGGDGDDFLIGGANNDALNGGAGSDTASYAASAARVRVNLTSGTGLDADAQGDVLSSIENLVGSAFNDVLTGTSADNVLVANAGNDQINGQAGADTLTGNSGNDVFIFNTVLGGGNVDAITDFSVPDDTIWLDDAVYTGLALGTLAAGAFQTGAAATQADDRIIYNSATGVLLFDADGNGAGAAMQFATLATGLSLTNADFLVN